MRTRRTRRSASTIRVGSFSVVALLHAKKASRTILLNVESARRKPTVHARLIHARYSLHAPKNRPRTRLLVRASTRATQRKSRFLALCLLSTTSLHACSAECASATNLRSRSLLARCLLMSLFLVELRCSFHALTAFASARLLLFCVQYAACSRSLCLLLVFALMAVLHARQTFRLRLASLCAMVSLHALSAKRAHVRACRAAAALFIARLSFASCVVCLHARIRFLYKCLIALSAF